MALLEVDGVAQNPLKREVVLALMIQRKERCSLAFLRKLKVN